MKINEVERRAFLRKRYRGNYIVKNHPKLWAMHNFVNHVQLLRVEKDSLVRRWSQQENEKYFVDLLKYAQKALENLDYRGLQQLGMIMEIVLNAERKKPSDSEKARNALETYIEKKMDDAIAASDYPDLNQYYFVKDIKHPKFSGSAPNPTDWKNLPMEVTFNLLDPHKNSERLPIKITFKILYPTRKDLEEFLDESDGQRMEQIVRAAKAMGYRIRPQIPGVPPL